MKSFDTISKRNQIGEYELKQPVVSQIQFIKQKNIPIKLEVDQIKHKQSNVPKIHTIKQSSKCHIISHKLSKPVTIRINNQKLTPIIKKDKIQVEQAELISKLKQSNKGQNKYSENNEEELNNKTPIIQKISIKEKQKNQKMKQSQLQEKQQQQKQIQDKSKEIGVFGKLFSMFFKQGKQQTKNDLQQVNPSKQEKQKSDKSLNQQKNSQNQKSEDSKKYDYFQNYKQDQLNMDNFQNKGRQSKVSQYEFRNSHMNQKDLFRQSSNPRKSQNYLSNNMLKSGKTQFQLQDEKNTVFQITTILPQII